MIFKTIKSFCLLVGMTLVLASCLKKNGGLPNLIEEDDNAPRVVELIRSDDLHLTNSTIEEPQTIALNATPTIEEFTVGIVNVGSRSIPSVPITVKLRTNNSPLTTQGLDTVLTNAHLEAIPANAITFLTDLNGVQIGPNNKEAQLKIRLDKSALDLSKSYGLAFEIMDPGQGNITNPQSNVLLLQVLIKNQYDGIYSYISGQVTRYTAPGVLENPSTLSGPLGPSLPDVKFVTTGANTVQIQVLRWTTGGEVGGVAPVTVTVDPATNLTTGSAGANATFANWAGQENKYDPATKTFTLNFRWNPAGATREYSVVFRYKGPR